MDANGYPDDVDLEYLRQELNTFDFSRGANALGQMITDTGYGRATLISNPIGVKGYLRSYSLEIATGGWSGCEDILSAAVDTPWWSRYWESTHRGGLFVFKE